MKKTILSMISLVILISVIISGCGVGVTTENTSGNSKTVNTADNTITENTSNDSQSTNSAVTAGSVENMNIDELFSSRDLSGEIDTKNAVNISLNGETAAADSESVSISGADITISQEGIYIISGTLKNGSIIVNADKEDKVQLVLNGVSITSDDFAPIYVVAADKVFITLADNTDNTLINGGSFNQIDDNNVDAVIYSKDDITFNGSGTLTVESPAGHGIVGKDEVTIASGVYNITSSKTAIRANDSISIADGTFTLSAGTDGIHAENNDDDTSGNVYIKGGTFAIKVGDDGIHATAILQIDGGTFDITAAEGFEATYIKINDGKISISASDDGINAAKKSSSITPTVEINGGDTTVTMGQGDTDGVDSNGNIVINGGKISVTGNSTFDYDGTGVINGGTVIVNGSEVSSLPNQIMGGPGGNGGFGRNEGFGGNGGFR